MDIRTNCRASVCDELRADGSASRHSLIAELEIGTYDGEGRLLSRRKSQLAIFSSFVRPRSGLTNCSAARRGREVPSFLCHPRRSRNLRGVILARTHRLPPLGRRPRDRCPETISEDRDDDNTASRFAKWSAGYPLRTIPCVTHRPVLPQRPRPLNGCTRATVATSGELVSRGGLE